MNGARVVVIGGGLAGITAALDCADRGATVTLLEARGRLGGAAYSFTRHGIQADNGQHVFLRCCTGYRELLDRIGAADCVTMQSQLEIAVLSPGGGGAWLRRSSLPAPFHLVGAMARYPLLSPRQRLSVARAIFKLSRLNPDAAAVDQRSFGDWLREQRQDVQSREAVWSLIERPTLNLKPEDASLAQVAQVFQTGLLQDASAGDIGHARVPLSKIHDDASRRALASAGVTVLLRHAAAAIEPTADGYRVAMSGSGALEADAVVLAVPPERAVGLVPAGAGLDPEVATRLGRSPIVNLHIVYDRPVLDVPFVAVVGSPVQWVFDRTQSGGLEAGQYLVVSLSAADDERNATAEELQARFLPAMAAVLPAARAATVSTFFVTREHSATFRAGPGARAWRPGTRTRLPGLVLAGAWTDTGWPATMEGAVRSGHAAAREAMQTAQRPAAGLSAHGQRAEGDAWVPAEALPAVSAAVGTRLSEGGA